MENDLEQGETGKKEIFDLNAIVMIFMQES